MRYRDTTALRGLLVGLAVAAATPGAAATITGWNTDNVDVGPVLDETNEIGDSGASVVYDQAKVEGAIPPGAESSGQIVYSWDESNSPGIKVVNDPYEDTGAGSTLTLDGCIMASSTATCDDGFQSGKRIKQQMTGTDPVDLVFDVGTSTAASVYQVFGRLINVTGQALDGFKIELGFGIGDAFEAATEGSGISFSTLFTAQPSGSGSSSSQFPFGLFGDAEDSPNFLLDGFFDDERTGFELFQDITSIESLGYYGNYANLFGPWNDQGAVPDGLFWDFDNDDTTDALLMAWQIGEDLWELRRDAGETCEGEGDDEVCTPGTTRGEYLVGSFDEIVAALGVDTDLLDVGGIEDLANLNLNFAIALDAVVEFTSFTLRTTVYPAAPSVIPLPAGAPLLLAGLGAFAALRRRRTASAGV